MAAGDHTVEYRVPYLLLHIYFSHGTDPIAAYLLSDRKKKKKKKSITLVT